MPQFSKLLFPKAALAIALGLSLAVADDSSAQLGTTLLTSEVTLAELITNDGSVTVGDKVFSDFTYAATGQMPSADNVNVFGIIDNLGNYGLRFQGGFIDLPGDNASDALITYLITVTDPNFAISGARMQGNVDIITTESTPSSIATVTDTFLPEVTNQNLTIFEDSDELVLDASVFFNDTFTTLNAQKDILLLTSDDDNATTLSFVDQTYYQVPEPTSLALIGLGAMLTMRRRRDR